MDMKALLKQLVEAESPSHDKSAVDRVAALVAEQARKFGADVEAISNKETGDHILARWGSGKDGILLLCHMDTVFPLGTLSKIPYRQADGKIFGPGVLDMKAGIVISLAAIEEARKHGMMRHVTLLCTSDEEIGSHTSREWIESLAKESALVLVLEGALLDGSLKTWRKGAGEFRVKVKGRAAHAGGDHEKGRNAIEEMAHQVISIQKLTDYSKGTTLNVGVIHGGTVSNVVPEQTDIEVDVRIMQPSEWERLNGEMKKLKPVLDGTSIEITGGLNRPPMPFDDGMKATFEKAKSIAADIGVELKAGGTGGAVGEGYHSEREYIFESCLEEKKKLLVELMRKW